MPSMVRIRMTTVGGAADATAKTSVDIIVMAMMQVLGRMDALLELMLNVFTTTASPPSSIVDRHRLSSSSSVLV